MVRNSYQYQRRQRPNQEPLAQAQLQPSDYESDLANLSDLPAPPPTRSNSEINLTVLRRYEPTISQILSIANYAVVYVFSTESQTWEKNDIEGTMFVCQLSPSEVAKEEGIERYKVIILNRRGLDNFTADLTSSNDVEITDQYVILRSSSNPGNAPIYGLWIFSEPPPSSTAETRTRNAKIIEDCAAAAEASTKAMRAKKEKQVEHSTENSRNNRRKDPIGRQVNLQELFGHQQAADGVLQGAKVGHEYKAGNPSRSQQLNIEEQIARPAMFAPSRDTEFFRRPPKSTQKAAEVTQPGSERYKLDQLLKNAVAGYEGR
ncbi:MAG: hypothetical protein M1824_005504 [Vezdaea acicularis]|nr:MAG: hypothetical protein M1824_005504 [Vezdaea acicularis]